MLGTALLDVTIPPGLKDAQRHGLGRAPDGVIVAEPSVGIDGIRIVKVKILGSGPGQIGFKVVAKNASLPVTGVDLPLAATIVFDPPQAETTGRCGTSASRARPGSRPPARSTPPSAAYAAASRPARVEGSGMDPTHPTRLNSGR